MGAKFLFVTWWGGGNVFPVVALSRGLVSTGHEVDVLGPPMLSATFEGTGATFVPQQAGAAWSDGGPAMLAAEVLSTAAAGGYDAVIVDFMQPEALSAVEKSGHRFAAFVHTLPQPVIDRRGDTMGAFVPLATLNELRQSIGLDTVGDVHELLARADAVLGGTARAIDRVADTANVAVDHLGPLIDEPGPDGGWEPPRGDGALVAVGLGTTPMGEEPTLANVVEALSTMPVRVHVSVGDHVDPGSVRAPANVRVTGFVRHSAVLAHADVFINHAGLGSVTAGATFGVPQLCVPLGRDQPDNAMRVVELGVGTSITQPSVDTIRDAVAALLSDASFTSGARHLQARIAADHPPGSAVRMLESFAES